jgi:hypothetical protein
METSKMGKRFLSPPGHSAFVLRTNGEEAPEQLPGVFFGPD